MTAKRYIAAETIYVGDVVEIDDDSRVVRARKLSWDDPIEGGSSEINICDQEAVQRARSSHEADEMAILRIGGSFEDAARQSELTEESLAQAIKRVSESGAVALTPTHFATAAGELTEAQMMADIASALGKRGLNQDVALHYTPMAKIPWLAMASNPSEHVMLGETAGHASAHGETAMEALTALAVGVAVIDAAGRR